MLGQPVPLPGFKVIGIGTRTTNQQEMSGTGCIGALWGRFLSGAGSEIPGVIDPAIIYSVYSTYESDETGPYNVAVCKRVAETERATQGFVEIAVPAARYMTFPAMDATPQSIMNAWGEVYVYFQQHGTPKRAFSVDFERHSPAKIELFIAVV